MILRVALPVVLFAGWIGWTMPGEPLAPPPPVSAQTAVLPSSPAAPWAGDIVLPREADGHFYADIAIDGQHVRFLVDTGASLPALTAADAQRLGFAINPSEARVIGHGASGPLSGKRITLRTVTIGNKRIDNLEAVIVSSGLPVSLLGQSFLRQLGSLTISDDTMVLR